MPIYLDHAATTPLRPEALEAMLPFLGGEFGNPSSAHQLGRSARAALDEAHERIAEGLGAEPREIVLTSGGTESINLGLKGAAWAGSTRGRRIVTTSVEHHATSHALRHLEKYGFEILEIPVDRYGRFDPGEVAGGLTDGTILVSLILANNEVGTIEPVRETIELIRRQRGIVVHVDAVQAAPYLPIDVRDLDVDLLSIAAHKFEGPKGVGALFVRRGTTLLAQAHGGSQERHRRAGTENVAGAVGMGVAFELAVRDRAATVAGLAALRDALRAAILAVPGTELTGHPDERLPNHLSVVVPDADGSAIALSLDLEGLAISTGSACATGSAEVSHVLTAMGYPPEEAAGALRFSLGRTTTPAEIETAIDLGTRAIEAHQAGGRIVAGDPLGRELGAGAG